MRTVLMAILAALLMAVPSPKAQAGPASDKDTLVLEQDTNDVAAMTSDNMVKVQEADILLEYTVAPSARTAELANLRGGSPPLFYSQPGMLVATSPPASLEMANLKDTYYPPALAMFLGSQPKTVWGYGLGICPNNTGQNKFHECQKATPPEVVYLGA